ncbi:MAG TPA: hypothetical protein VF613_02880 [Longimicrobium sp.]|jgi:hypothetical protein
MRALLVLLLLAAAASAQNRAAPAAATSSWEATYNAAGEETRHGTVSRTFAFATRGTVPMLLAQEIRATVRNDREGVDGRVRTTAYARTGRGYGRVLWTVDAAGSEAGVADDLYWVQEPACCATQPTRRYFSLRTGRPLFHATSAVADLASDMDEPRRRVAFLSASGTVQSPAFRGVRGAMGILQLIVNDSIRQRVLVTTTEPAMEMDAPLLGVMVTSGGRRPVNTVWMRFSDGREARIPVTAAGLAVNAATLPRGIALK